MAKPRARNIVPNERVAVPDIGSLLSRRPGKTRSTNAAKNCMDLPAGHIDQPDPSIRTVKA